MRTTSVLMLLVSGLRAVSAANCDNGGTEVGGVCQNCPTGTTAQTTPLNCICTDTTQGYDPDTGACAACPTNEDVNTSTGRCECAIPFGLDTAGACVTCSDTGFTRGTDGNCECVAPNGIQADGTTCGPCTGGTSLDANGDCSCVAPSGTLDGTCQLCSTSGREANTQTGACDCVAPKGLDGSGTCISCTDGGQVLGSDGNCADSCATGFESVDGVCETVCPTGQVRNSAGVCEANTSTTPTSSPTSSPTESSTEPPTTEAPTTTPTDTATSNTESSTETEVPTSTEETTTAESSPATSGPDSTTPVSSTPTSSSTTAAPTSTDGPLPAQLGDFSFVGCAGSDASFPTFTLQFTNAEMTLDLCTAACNQHLYAGIFQTSCYCADSFEEAATVSPGSCDIPCPGNPAQNCGGLRQFVKRQNVPSNALLVVYINDPVAATATVPTSVATTTLSATTTATTTAVTTETAYPCMSGYCHAAGWVFELCNGLPLAGELVWILSPCSCLGGWQYIQASCDGASCAGQTVYRVVPYTGAANQTGLTVYQPAPCTSGCSGEVVFTQPSGGAAATVTGSTASPSTPVVVTAGAGKVAGSLMGLLGVFALLM